MTTITPQQWTADLQHAADALPRAAQDVLQGAAKVAQGRARLLASTRLRVRSGRLRESIAARVARHGAALDLALQAGGLAVPYAAIQEHGGVVHARAGRYLSLHDGPGSRWARRERVTLLGRHYLRDAIPAAQAEVERALPAAVERLVDGGR